MRPGMLILFVLSVGGLVHGGAFDLGLGVHQRVRQSEPMLVEATLFFVGEGDSRIELKDSAAWTTALKLRLQRVEGEAVEVEWERLAAAEGALRFSEDAPEAGALLGLGPEATGKLEPGEYLLSASLDTEGLAAAEAWAGKLTSRKIRLRVLAADAERVEGEEISERRRRARWLALHGERDAALALLDEVLQGSQNHLDAMLEKADLLLEMERRDDAVAVLESALRLFRERNPKATHPPREILRRLHESGAI